MADNLTTTVKTWWKNRERSATKGLVHMVATIHQIAGRDENGDPLRNWDPAATLLGLMGADSNEGIHYRRILRAAFGNQITLRKDDKHETGFRFIFTDKIPDGPKGAPVIRNTFGLVQQAAERGVAFNSSNFQKKLKEALDEAEPRTPQLWDEKKAEKAVRNLLEKAEKEHFSVARLINMLEEAAKPLLEEERKANKLKKAATVQDIDDAAAA